MNDTRCKLRIVECDCNKVLVLSYQVYLYLFVFIQLNHYWRNR